jgi:hypothetical protein
LCDDNCHHGDDGAFLDDDELVGMLRCHSRVPATMSDVREKTMPKAAVVAG